MGALPTSLHNFPTTAGAMKLHLGVGKVGRREADSSAPRLRICSRSVGPRSLSEEWALVQGALAGDSDSLDRLFAAHTAKLYRTAFAMLRNKEDAEDAVQDALCSAYTKLRSFQGRSSFLTWLTRIVINSAHMNRRRKGARPEASLDEILDSQEGWVTHKIVDLRPDPEKICSVIEIDALVKKEV